MIINNKNRDVKIIGKELNSTKMKLGDNIDSHLIKLLTEESYKDGLGSGIRETVSNAIDSHTEAKQTCPVIIKYNTINKVLSIEDFGIGLDDISFKKYIMGVGESTKKDDPNLIGGYGIGAKAFLSYTDNYIYICRKDGNERRYLIFKGESLPEATLIAEHATKEPNGVKVEVVNNTVPDYRIIEIINKQCSYINNVKIIIDDNVSTHEIIDYGHYRIQNLHKFSQLHISLKGIYYPINWDLLKIKPIYLPIAIRFDDYNALKPIYNREDLQWDKETVNVIFNKIKLISNEIIEDFNKNYSQLDNIVELIGSNLDYQIEFSFSEKKVKYNIKELFSHSDIPVSKYFTKGFKSQITSFFRDNLWVINQKFEPLFYKWDHRFNSHLTQQIRDVDKKNHYLLSEPPRGYLREYLKEKYPDATFYKELFFSKKSNFKYELSFLKNLIKNRPLLKDIGYKELVINYRKIIKQIKEIFFVDLTEIRNNPKFIEWVKKEKRKNKGTKSKSTLIKEKEDITIDFIYKTPVRHNISIKKSYINKNELKKAPYIIIYGSQENKEMLFQLYSAFSKQKSVKLAIINKDNLVKIKDYTNIICIKNMQDTKPFKRLASAILFDDLINQVDCLIGKTKKHEIIRNLYPNLLTSFKKLRTYVDDNYYSISTNAKDYILDIAKEYDLFDKYLWEDYLFLKQKFDVFESISILEEPSYWNKEKYKIYIKTINQLLLFRKLYYKDFENAKIILEEKEELSEVTT